jgi:hypothetical protein
VSAVKNVLAAVLVVSVASIALSQAPAPEAAALPAPPAPAILQTWEYKVSERGGILPPAWETKLNDMAKEGWELDAIDEGHYIFRRRFQAAVVGGGFF